MKISIVNINSVRSCYFFFFFQNSIFEQIGKTYNFSFAPRMKNESTTVPEGLGKRFLLQSFREVNEVTDDCLQLSSRQSFRDHLWFS